MACQKKKKKNFHCICEFSRITNDKAVKGLWKQQSEEDSEPDMKLVWLLNGWITSVTIHSQGSSFLSVLWSWTWLWQSLGLVFLHYRGVNWVPEILDDFPTLYNEVLLGLEPEPRPLPCKPWGHFTTFWFPCPMTYLSAGGTWGLQGGPTSLPYREVSILCLCFL